MEECSMSELMDNRKQRRETLKGIIRDIHRQKDPEELKNRFKELISDIGATEIAQLEQELIKEGLPESEIKNLCDVHVAVFQEGLEKQEKPEQQGGHPVHTFRKENSAIKRVLEQLYPVLERIKTANSQDQVKEELQRWKELHEQITEIEKHYSRKENILFAYLEKHGVGGPPKVMWAIHDDIRAQIKEVSRLLTKSTSEINELKNGIEQFEIPALKAIDDMIYKEENILFPMSMETLSEGEWAAVQEQSDDIGYALIQPDHGWVSSVPPEPVISNMYSYTKEDDQELNESMAQALLPFETGALTLEQISLILNHLPVDVTFVDQNDRVRYFSYGKERIFQRSKAIIGRNVEDCHPPDSVHIVKKIVEDFRSGKRDSADFWIKMGDKFVYIQYFAVRNAQGEYRGTTEVTQDVQNIRNLQGEKRIYSER
jgi:uncharacterized protein